MAFVAVNPRYQTFLEQQGLTGPERLLALPAVIISGHPDRHVAQVTLGEGAAAVRAFLKREHRVPWKERLANAWGGFGFVSKSYREYLLLLALRGVGIPCPEPIAAGEDSRGRAFLLVRELSGACDLRLFLRDRRAGQPAQRRELARRLGEALSLVHDAGFDHPDLYSKHVLVNGRSGALHFLDWQRARRRRFVGWPQRWHALAALDATLAAEAATARERLTCLRAYLRATLQVHVPRPFVAAALHHIRRHSRRLQCRRRVRELRQSPLNPGTQNLIWLDGEALCVTRAFQDEMPDGVAEWLSEAGRPAGPAEQVQQSVVPLPGLRQAALVRRRSHRPLRWLWALLHRRPLTSPELEQAATLFRLQRFGVATPRLLAVGQRHPRPWQTESFLLTEHTEGAVPLACWLARQSGRPLWTAELKQRRRLLRQAGDMLRRLRDAGYRAGHLDARHFLLQPAEADDAPPRVAVVLGSLEGIVRRQDPRADCARRELAALHEEFSDLLGSGTDRLRFLLAYLGLGRLTPAARRLVRGLTGQAEGGRQGTRPWGRPRLVPERAAS
jgi:tRNA A-37 threonylcarbamoyl transferase component Bud32